MLQPSMILDGNALAFPLVTNAHWMLSCLPATSNGAGGEGFLAVSPDGGKYWFDRLVTGGWDWFAPPFMSGSALYRYEAMLLPSRIEDRHGNALTFTYDGARLTGIQASDGRAVSLSWQSVNGISFVTGVTEQPGDAKARTWTYAYTTPALGRTLRKVTLPDATAWSFDFNALTKYCAFWSPDPQQEPYCDSNPGAWGSNVGTATAPSGLVGTFTVAGVLRYRWLEQQHLTPQCFHEHDGIEEYQSIATLSRRYTGPGVDSTWTYGYCDDYNASCAPDVPSASTFRITAPDGSKTRQLVGHAWCSATLGEVLRTEFGATFNGNTFVSAARTIRPQLASPNAGPFPARIGTVPQTYANRAQLEHLRPLRQRDIVQDGVTFTWKADSLDGFGRPRTVTRSSTLGASTTRTETITYHDNFARWVLGQIAGLKEANTAAPMLAQTFDAATGNVLTSSRFGALQHTLSYYPSGLVRTIADGAGNVTTLSNYKRGIPQTVVHPDGTSSKVAVDNVGQVTGSTDELGHTTGYLHDALGRLIKTTWPSGDSVAWNATERTFEAVNVAEYGLPAGHWRLTERTGNARAITYYDALWRPVLQRSFDNADEAGTRRMVLRRYDGNQRETFVSYPQRSIASVLSTPAGVATTYDGLGRPRTHTATSELGPLTTTIDYLAGFKRRTTNPRGIQRTETFHALDSPDTAALAGLQVPDAVTGIARDVFGKPRTMTRSGQWNGNALTLTRRYVYDAQQRLCKRIEPESGATVLDYDAAGNIAWQATGQNLPSHTDCQRGSVPVAQRSAYSHDTRGRLLAVDHPSDAADLAFSYFANGLLQTAGTAATANAPASLWTYAYTKRGLPLTETLAFDGKNSVIAHGHDANGARASLTWPSGLALAYAPNALGEPTRVGTYATGAGYHPGGALATWTYGNGVVREHLLNARQLPDRLRDTRNGVALLDHGFDYDPNGNLVARTDGVGDGLESSDLTYDDLDRLRTAVVPNKFGLESFEYDPLDNIRRAVVGPLDLRYDIDTNNRLQRITQAGDTVHAYTWNARGALATRSRPGEPDPHGLFRDGFETGGDLLPATVQTLVFDSANRLARIDGLERYAYDAHGHRLRTRRDTGTVRHEIRDRSGRLLYTEDTRDQQRTDYIALGTTLVAKRTRPLNGNTATTTYLHGDARGTPSVESNAVGQMLLRTRLTSYGAPYDGLWRDGPGFTGHTADAASQLVYMQQRYFDPLALRFLSPDPVAPTPESFNRYWYANNNPYKFLDPDGRWACTGVHCATFEASLRLASQASASDQLSSSQQTQLRRAVDFYGAKGDQQIKVTFANLGGELAQNLTDESGRGEIRFDVEGIAQRNPGQAGVQNGLAMRLLHEADHGAQIVKDGFPTSKEERLNREHSAYRAEGYYQKAMNFLQNSNNIWAPWHPGDGIDQGRVDARAQFSVMNSCSHSNEWSCK
ncbi:RHS repeat domain-containing protein [Chiayiivirga flava]